MITTSALASLPAGFIGPAVVQKELLKTNGVYTSKVAFRGYFIPGTIGLASGVGAGAFLGGKLLSSHTEHL